MPGRSFQASRALGNSHQTSGQRHGAGKQSSAPVTGLGTDSGLATCELWPRASCALGVVIRLNCFFVVLFFRRQDHQVFIYSKGHFQVHKEATS